MEYLPREIIGEILTYLPTKDLASAASINRGFRELITNPQFLVTLLVRKYPFLQTIWSEKPAELTYLAWFKFLMEHPFFKEDPLATNLNLDTYYAYVRQISEESVNQDSFYFRSPIYCLYQAAKLKDEQLFQYFLDHLRPFELFPDDDDYFFALMALPDTSYFERAFGLFELSDDFKNSLQVNLEIKESESDPSFDIERSAFFNDKLIPQLASFQLLLEHVDLRETLMEELVIQKNLIQTGSEEELWPAIFRKEKVFASLLWLYRPYTNIAYESINEETIGPIIHQLELQQHHQTSEKLAKEYLGLFPSAKTIFASEISLFHWLEENLDSPVELIVNTTSNYLFYREHDLEIDQHLFLPNLPYLNFRYQDDAIFYTKQVDAYDIIFYYIYASDYRLYYFRLPLKMLKKFYKGDLPNWKAYLRMEFYQ